MNPVARPGPGGAQMSSYVPISPSLILGGSPGGARGGPEGPKGAQMAQNGPKWPKMAQIAPFGPLWPVCAHIQGSTRHVLSQSELPRSPKSLDFPCFRGKSNGFTGPDRPRGAQECPIHALWIRGRGPKGPKGAQRDPKGPKRAQKGPKPPKWPKMAQNPQKVPFSGFLAKMAKND